MQVRSFFGKSTKEVLEQIKAELGTEAVILSSREVVKGGQTWHEITAGVDRNGPMQRQVETVQHHTGQLLTPAESAENYTGGPPAWAEWHREWTQIKEHLLAMMKPSMRLDTLTPRQRLAIEFLTREGVEDQVILKLYRQLAQDANISILAPLSEMVTVSTWGSVEWRQPIHVFAGPFGNGKTTAALRMALLLREETPNLPILFINADCARGNGRLLLRHYTELSDMAYKEADSGPECLEILREWGQKLAKTGGNGKIFVDLPGVGRDTTLSGQLAQLGLTGSGVATHLVLCPHVGTAQQAALLARYRGVANSVIWTKLDEAVSYGSIVNTSASLNLPISALSYGPGMADTLSPATTMDIWKLIFKRQLPEKEEQ